MPLFIWNACPFPWSFATSLHRHPLLVSLSSTGPRINFISLAPRSSCPTVSNITLSLVRLSPILSPNTAPYFFFFFFGVPPFPLFLYEERRSPSVVGHFYFLFFIFPLLLTPPPPNSLCGLVFLLLFTISVFLPHFLSGFPYFLRPLTDLSNAVEGNQSDYNV